MLTTLHTNTIDRNWKGTWWYWLIVTFCMFSYNLQPLHWLVLLSCKSKKSSRRPFIHKQNPSHSLWEFGCGQFPMNSTFWHLDEVICGWLSFVRCLTQVCSSTNSQGVVADTVKSCCYQLATYRVTKDWIVILLKIHLLICVGSSSYFVAFEFHWFWKFCIKTYIWF